MGVWNRGSLPHATRTGGRRTRPGGVLLTVVGLACVGLLGVGAQAAGATALTSPGGGESFKIHPGDSFKVGYDFTVPGNHKSVAVQFRHLKATVHFTCPNGSDGSFVVTMPDYTVTVSDSRWYPSGDQHSSLVYQGAVTAPSACGKGVVMHQKKIAAFTGDVYSQPSGVKLNYRFHDVDNSASGSWSATDSVVTTTPPSETQTIKGEIYKCVYGEPTTILVGGAIAVPAANLSSPNPLPATSIAAGTYTMNATSPAGWKFDACGRTGVSIATGKTSAHQTVTVPPGGQGEGKFYVSAGS